MRTHFTRRLLGVALAGVLGIALGGSAQALTLANAGFEDGGFSGDALVLSSGVSPALPGWEVIRSVTLHAGLWQAAEGDAFVALNGDRAGRVQQTLVTVPGETYHVSFALSGEPGGADPMRRLYVAAAGSSAEYSFDTTGLTPGAMVWAQPVLFSFVATDTTTLLRFESLTPGEHGPAIDGMAIAPETPTVVPEPGTAALSMLGLAGLAALGRRRES